MDQNWCKIRICLVNNQGNFQLYRFTTSENIAKSFKGDGTHTVYTRHACMDELLHFQFVNRSVVTVLSCHRVVPLRLWHSDVDGSPALILKFRSTDIVSHGLGLSGSTP